MDCSFISEIPPKIWEIISEKFGGKITINQLRKINKNRNLFIKYMNADIVKKTNLSRAYYCSSETDIIIYFEDLDLYGNFKSYNDYIIFVEDIQIEIEYEFISCFNPHEVVISNRKQKPMFLCTLRFTDTIISLMKTHNFETFITTIDYKTINGPVKMSKVSLIDEFYNNFDEVIKKLMKIMNDYYINHNELIKLPDTNMLSSNHSYYLNDLKCKRNEDLKYVISSIDNTKDNE
jgi:hypothetical protein